MPTSNGTPISDVGFNYSRSSKLLASVLYLEFIKCIAYSTSAQVQGRHKLKMTMDVFSLQNSGSSAKANHRAESDNLCQVLLSAVSVENTHIGLLNGRSAGFICRCLLGAWMMIKGGWIR